MEISRESLKQRYSDLVDAELIRRVRSGVLTELAHEVAVAELQQRGVAFDQDVPPDATSRLDDIDFEPDEFAHNPYQSPRPPATRASAADTKSSIKPGRSFVDVLWFLYAAIIALVLISSMVTALLGGRVRDLFHPATAAPLLGLVGLVAWRLRKAIVSPLLWVACLGLSAALFIIQLKAIWKFLATIEMRTLLDGASPGLTILAVVALELPLIVALACYAFASPSIWRRDKKPRSVTPT
ncbi:MAG: hypothetical protein JNN30_01895 [Rhodanobacteraceae bacterium]|nr:hypothetical protein [Rhodanobacteraceae bacterium]